MAVLGLGCCAGFSLVVQSRGYSVAVVCVLIVVASLVVEWSLGCTGLQQLQFPGSKVQAQQLWCIGFVAPWHVGSSQIRDGTYIFCIGRRIPHY